MASGVSDDLSIKEGLDQPSDATQPTAMSFDCLPLLLGLLLLLISVVDCRDGERHHRHNWLVAAIPTEDGDDDGSQLRQAMDDFVKRVQPELEVRDTVFDLTTVAQMPATTAPTTTTTTTVRPVRSSDRPLPPHPYMQMLYEEIDDRRNEKWVEMDNTGATIRGIEPIRVTTEEGEQTTALDFAIGTINDLDAIHHVDLVLTSSNYSSFESSSMESSSMESDENDVVEVYIQSLNDSTSPMKLMTYRKMATDDNRWSFLVLEMTPTIRDWWSNGHLKATQTIHLTSSNVHLQRPLLVFYYVTDKGVQDGGLRQQQQRKKRSFPHSFGSSRTHTRPCSQRCVHAQRRQPPINETAKDGGHRSCTLRSWDVTLRDLQWEAKVVAPYSLQMNYCSGSCEAPIYDASYNATNHAVVRSVLLTQMHDAANSFPPPYCVPTSLEADTFMFLENEQFYIKNMDNIVAKKCGCR